jgi:hypothetical protein
MSDLLSVRSRAFDEAELRAIPAVLSAARFETYLRASAGDRAGALHLYAWNAEVSAAFSPPLQIAEVAIRNAIAEALERSYKTSAWHESKTFAADLKDPEIGFSPRKDLTTARKTAERQIRAVLVREQKKAESDAGRRKKFQPKLQAAAVVVPVGKVIAELRFAFWVSLLTASHQERLWDDQLRSAFPYLPGAAGDHAGVSAARKILHDDVDAIRTLRNRIAHHEPVQRYRLPDEVRRIIRVVGWRCPVTARWLEREQKVSSLLLQKI